MPTRQGFDYFYGFMKHRTAHHYYPKHVWRNEEKIRLKDNYPKKKKGDYSHDMFTNEAISFISRNIDNPFFLYLAYTIPHYELTVPKDSKDPYEKLNWQKRRMESGHYYHDQEGNSTYAGMISRLDRDVGKIIEFLHEKNLDQNTIVFFTSDNGHEFDESFFDSNGPLRGKKRDLYEGGIRVPLIVLWPGKIPPQSTTHHISAFWDVYPTLCDIAGVTPENKIDGISFLPTLVGSNDSQKTHEYLYWEFNERQGPIKAIRKGDWKLIHFMSDNKFELYNLKTDIGEKNNLYESEALLAEELRKLMKVARTPDSNFPLIKLKR